MWCNVQDQWMQSQLSVTSPQYPSRELFSMLKGEPSSWRTSISTCSGHSSIIDQGCKWGIISCSRAVWFSACSPAHVTTTFSTSIASSAAATHHVHGILLYHPPRYIVRPPISFASRSCFSLCSIFLCRNPFSTVASQRNAFPQCRIMISPGFWPNSCSLGSAELQLKGTRECRGER